MSQTEKVSEENSEVNLAGDTKIKAVGNNSSDPGLESKEKLTDQANSDTLCELCDAKILSEQAAQRHFDGAKHKKKVKRYQTMKSLAKEFGVFIDEPEEDIERKLSLPRLSFLEKQVAKMLNCATCNISVTGFENMLSHLGTTKHQQAVLAANGYKPPNKEQNEKGALSTPINKTQLNKKKPTNPVPSNNKRPSDVTPSGSRINSAKSNRPANPFQSRGRGRGRGAPQGMRPVRPKIMEQSMANSFNDGGFYGTSGSRDFQSSKQMGSFDSNNQMSSFGGYAPQENFSFNKPMYYDQDPSFKFKYSGGFSSNEEHFGMESQSTLKRHYADDSPYHMPSKKPAYYGEDQQYSMDYNHGDFSSYKGFTGMY